MSKIIEVTVPDIGDFKNVDVIEILVKPGDKVQKDSSLIALESEKATMEIPSSHAGVVKAIKLKVGDKVSQGSLILTLEAEQESAPTPQTKAPEQPAAKAASTKSETEIQADVVVLGAGPGGYTAAFRAADLGKKVVLIERYPNLGGVCLNVGCIPSKALLHIAKVISEAEQVSRHGVSFGKPKIDIDQIRAWKESVVTKLTGGLGALAKQRNVQIIRGVGKFIAPHHIRVETADALNGTSGEVTVTFDNAIIAAGSQAVKIPAFPVDPRVMDSTGALQLADVPKKMLVIGGGIISLEMATVYHALGTKITIVEHGAQLIHGCDPDIVRPLQKRIEKRYEAILLNTSVVALEAKKAGILVTFGGEKAPAPQLFDRVLVAVGRRPNGKLIGAENAGVQTDDQGFIPVDKQQRTNVPHIFAIGDIVGQPMLAHKASHEGKVAAEVIAGHKAAFAPRAIPSVAYTDPEVAWMGLTETEAKAQGIAYEKASFPWAASGRALSIDRDEGLTKLIVEKNTRRILGAGIVGSNAGELIAEAVLALEMGADAQDIGLTIHPHPTLSETLGFAAEMVEGTITDLYIKRR
ncbi:MAG: dihydrolipoyl dehydrogenase [Betaproteobacteria bacterium CG2_30_59_46]|nr:MAG: dihydrolipoyl dehydrogenase [Betaproteobacteria bacterium CG2_30_59_46]PIQ14184.1 MAG: dihydrolipoyl dehydrogenase [Hydrogenophilales bacterium CG18_big_fil_WC_8_21_14_2_50_58_12]PIY00863.1 MAG: dihydrolipoyl dehydrogenase [Hydrogenophilales bacterium CG_4_10_14_3_um_filter_58_23]PJB08832.1 MAG: dihydrolipoyl dehydrogenase [Hydrogenophilales bacterium CG_4_9_14_3_um_filter_59_35]